MGWSRSINMRLRKVQAGWRGVVAAIEALAALVLTQAALRFCHFRSVRRVLLAVAERFRTRRPLESGTLLWAMSAAKRRCPVASTCLGEALVAEALFRQHGYNPTLCMGAARREGRFEAHAWLEQDQAVVIGGPAEVVKQYTRFPEIASLTL
jgi:hypothetical protein